MTALLDPAAAAVTLAGLVVLALGTACRGWREGLRGALDLWTAAGLLRLAAEPDWSRVAGVAAIVAVRHLVSFGLRAQPARR